MKVFTYSENKQISLELIAFAKEHGSDSICAFAADKQMAELLAVSGANEVMYIKLPEGTLKEDIADSIAEVVKSEPKACVLVGSTRRGLAAAARIATNLDTVAISDVKDVNTDNGISAVHMIYGGKLTVTDKASGHYTVLLVSMGSAEPLTQGASSTNITEGIYVAPASTAQVIGHKSKPAGSTDINSARVVVCVGRGVEEQEQLDDCFALAKAIGGVVGCSRPITEGDNALMADEPYIGSSGITVKPDIYIGIGVSGQTQHSMGMIGSKRAVIINQDPKAPFFRKCDYGIVGNMNDIVPVITTALMSVNK